MVALTNPNLFWYWWCSFSRRRTVVGSGRVGLGETDEPTPATGETSGRLGGCGRHPFPSPPRIAPSSGFPPGGGDQRCMHLFWQQHNKAPLPGSGNLHRQGLKKSLGSDSFTKRKQAATKCELWTSAIATKVKLLFLLSLAPALWWSSKAVVQPFPPSSNVVRLDKLRKDAISSSVSRHLLRPHHSPTISQMIFYPSLPSPSSCTFVLQHTSPSFLHLPSSSLKHGLREKSSPWHAL